MTTAAPDSAIAAKITNSFAAQSMMASLGASLQSIGPGRCEIHAPILPGFLQQHGFGHAGLTFSLGDSAAGYAALTLMPLDGEVLTAEIKINLLAPARGDILIARGTVIKPGRRLIVVQSEVFVVDAGQQTRIALLQGTMVPVDP